MKYFSYNTYTPVETITLFCDDDYIIGLYFGIQQKSDVEEKATPVIQQAIHELDEYLSGKRKTFDVPTKLYGTEFQKSVWAELSNIPYGQTVSYGQIAANIKNPKAYRAVGLANNKNPISIIYPCHRVIGADGKLVGYGGGLEIKKFLLKLENGEEGKI